MLITYEATLIEKKEIVPEILLLRFSLPEDPSWTYQAGQYMIFHVPTVDVAHPARRLYSIASSPTEKTLDFIIEIVPNGVGSIHVKNLSVGQKTTLQGAAGLFTYTPTDRPVTMLATGTGIAPMYSILKSILPTDSTTPFKLLWGMKYAKDLYLIPELKKLVQEYTNFSFSVCLSREVSIADESCMIGRVTAGLQESTEVLSTHQYFLCGGRHVVEALREDLLKLQIPSSQIHFERFT